MPRSSCLTRNWILPLALLAPAGLLRAQALQDSGVLANWSQAGWTIKLASDDQTQVGTIGLGDPFDDGKLTRELKTSADEFPVPQGKTFSIYYLDAPSKLTTVRTDRIFRRKFFLVDARGQRLTLEAFRKVSPGSNVFVRIASPVSVQDKIKLKKDFVLNDETPGDVTIKASAVPGYVTQ